MMVLCGPPDRVPGALFARRRAVRAGSHNGYEPDELPGCSTPRRWVFWVWGCFGCGAGSGWGGGLGEPGGDLLFRVLRRSTIGAEGFHGRVRDGIGCLAPRCGHQAVAASGRRRTEIGGQRSEGRDRRTEIGGQSLISDL